MLSGKHIACQTAASTICRGDTSLYDSASGATSLCVELAQIVFSRSYLLIWIRAIPVQGNPMDAAMVPGPESGDVGTLYWCGVFLGLYYRRVIVRV